MKRAKPTRPPVRVAAASPRVAPEALAWIAIALVATAGALDIAGIGFFADDFHFLDVARRVPLLSALAGQHGVWPWYRPLSRELFFALVTTAGPHALVLAHAASLIVSALIAWQVRRVGERLLGARAGAIAMALVMTHALARFLLAWPSGFQDLLAQLLLLLALDAHLAGRPRRALAFAFLAPFAKETAFAVFPLLALLPPEARSDARRPRAWAGLALAGAAAVALHAAVRATWHSAGSESHVVRSFPALAAALVRVATDTIGHAPAFAPTTLALAIAAGGATAWLVASASLSATAPPRRGVAFALVATAISLVPLVVGHALGLLSAYAYYAFGALPWLALLVAVAIARLPRGVAATLAGALVAWNLACLAPRPPDADAPTTWTALEWSWPEAQRLAAVTERLSGDLRIALASRSDSIVVLYGDLPRGCYFQTEDGPATRVALDDPRARGYWLNAAPFGLRPDRLRLLAFDRAARHLRRSEFPPATRGALAATAFASGNAGATWAFACTGDSASTATFPVTYLRAAAALLARGPRAMLEQLAPAGLADSSEARATEVAQSLFGRSGNAFQPTARVLHHPLDAAAHVALAGQFRALHAAISEGVELRIAITLDPSLRAERLRLAGVLADQGLAHAARAEAERLAKAEPGTPEAAAARSLLSHLAVADSGDVESPLPRFEPR